MIKNILDYFSQASNVINVLLSIITGVISGVWVSIYYRKIDMVRASLQRLETGKLEFYNYLKSLEYGIEILLNNKETRIIQDTLKSYVYPFAMFDQWYLP